MSKTKNSPPKIPSLESLGADTPASSTIDLARAFRSIGQPMWSDELLGKLLAWATATGFMYCTTQRPMFDVLMVAADRFGIQGGRKPNIELVDKYVKPRLAELKALGPDTEWLPKLMERYHVEDWRAYDYGWAEDIET